MCSVCNHGFQQKCLLQQHFDFYHTKKPKRFVCKEHRKTCVYKKSLDVHMQCDHGDGNYKYVCDFCGKGFFHHLEFTIHRYSVHLKRCDYMCNRCQAKAFTTPGRLNAHLKICGNPQNIECNQCGKLFASKSSLATHITDSHREDIKYKCPICDDKEFNSKGGYYKHLCIKHNLHRSGVKLSDLKKVFDKCNSDDDGDEYENNNVQNKDDDDAKSSISNSSQK